MPNANFNALRVRGNQLAIKAFKRIRLTDPVVSRGFFTDTRFGYRFGVNEKRSQNMVTALNRIERITVGGGHAYDFVFDPDLTGKIELIVKVNWNALRAAATNSAAEDACTLVYMRKVNVIRLEREAGLGGLASPTAFLGVWSRNLLADGRITVINNDYELTRAV